MPMMALVNPVYDCLFRLAQPDSLNKEEEVGDPFGQLWRGGSLRCLLSMEASGSITS